MGKKKKKKKNRRKLYNKKEFVNIFCNNCGICEGDPTFCYNDVYRQFPHLFLTKVSKNIQEVRDWNKLKRMEGTSMFFDPGQFKYAFCHGLAEQQACGIDVVNCEHFGTCYELFKSQFFGKKQSKLSLRRKKKATKAKKYIAKPYPTLLISKDEKWEKFVKDTLSDGNIDREQDTVEASTI